MFISLFSLIFYLIMFNTKRHFLNINKRHFLNNGDRKDFQIKKPKIYSIL